MNKKSWLGTIATIVAIIGGLIGIYLFVIPEPSPTSLPPPIPEPELSFLEIVAGEYTLSSWTDAASGPIALGAKVTEGSLSIDISGTADWIVQLEQTSTLNPGRVEMTARGIIQLDTKQMDCVVGGEYNNTHHFDAIWGQTSVDVGLAVRGWAFGNPDDNFTISVDTRSDGTQIFQMRNSRGTFTWIKGN